MLAIQFDQVAHAPEQLIARKLLDLDDLALERTEVLVHAIFDVLDDALIGRRHEMHQVLRARAKSIGGASQIKAGHPRVADALELGRESTRAPTGHDDKRIR